MNTPHSAPPPNLQTLHTKPSWHNRAGRPDRSACFVITAAQLWRRIPEDAWMYRIGKPPRNTRVSSSNQSPCVARRLQGLCDRYADLQLWARDLWLLHKHQPPYPLKGDSRSAKTNALRHTPRPTGQRGDQPRAQHMRHDPILGQGPINPNRGVGFNDYKRLGLDCMWSTTLRIERIVQHDKLRQHFFVCPVCGSVSAGQRTGVDPTETYHSDLTPACYAAATNHRGKLPPGRVTKLYLPLCTEQEYDDAQTAELWLNTHTHPNRPLPPGALELIERYHELFAARSLRCRHCLGLRYGEVKSPKAANGIGGRIHEPKDTGKTPDPIGGFDPNNPAASVVKRRLTDQALLLQNIPKLTAPLDRAQTDPVPDASQTQRRCASPNPNPDDLPAHVREELLRLLFEQTTSFDFFKQTRRQTK